MSASNLIDRIITHTTLTQPTAARTLGADAAAAAKPVVYFSKGVGDFTFRHTMVAICECNGPSSSNNAKYLLIVYRHGGTNIILTPKCVLGKGNHGSVVSYECGAGLRHKGRAVDVFK